MAARRMMLPDYGTVSMKGTQYYRTRVTDQQGRRVSLYARTREELYQKEQEAIQQIENKTYRRSTPTVEEYCEKWLLMQSAQIRMTTLIDYTSKVKNYIIKPLGDMHMGDVTADDIRLALLAASKKSASVYKSVNVLYKCIFMEGGNVAVHLHGQSPRHQWGCGYQRLYAVKNADISPEMSAFMYIFSNASVSLPAS